MLLTLYFQYLAHSRCSITSVEQEEGKERKWEEGCKRKKEGKEGERERERGRKDYSLCGKFRKKNTWQLMSMQSSGAFLETMKSGME